MPTFKRICVMVAALCPLLVHAQKTAPNTRIDPADQSITYAVTGLDPYLEISGDYTLLNVTPANIPQK
ncbi:hypothetical protein JRV94_32050, partial [Paraburkholderia phenoliruptrix]